MNPVGRFRDRADDYVRFRPTYPAAAIDALLDGLGSPAALTAADVGAGTGIASRLLAERGVRVIAVEPGEAMRTAAEPHPGVRWVAARAEATGLADASAQLVLCAQSFHWFRSADALAEFARILVPGGRAALMWNRRSAADPLTRGYSEAIVAVSGHAEIDRAAFDPTVIARTGLFTPPVRWAAPSRQRVDLDGLLGRAHSTSYVPKAGPALEQLDAWLGRLHARHADPAGFVELVYDTEIWMATALEP